VTHAEFVAAYGAGRVRVAVHRARAARLVAERALLPFFLLPVFGIGVALALVGRWVAGALVFGCALALRALVRWTSAGFVLHRCLVDEAFYREHAEALLRIEPVGER